MHGTKIHTWVAAVFVVTSAFQMAPVSHAAPASKTDYPFRNAYPLPHRAHSVLTVTNMRLYKDDQMNAEIQFFNDGKAGVFYNTEWSRLMWLPGQIALYDADKHYLRDLTQYTMGSWSGPGVSSWKTIPAHGEMDATVPVYLSSHLPSTLKPGVYYVQVIYSGNAMAQPTPSNELSKTTSGELFRSNAVKITVLP